MNFKKKTIFLLLLILTIFLSSCSKEIDCSEQSGTYEVQEWNDKLEKCVVTRTIQKNVCNNNVTESGETYCNCPQDVPKTHPVNGCFKVVGDYVEEGCNDNKKCVFMQNEKVVEQIKSVEFKNSHITINSRFNYNQPYVFNVDDENLIEVEMSLFKLSTSYNIKNLIVKELRIEDTSSNLLGNIKYTEGLEEVDDKLKTKTVELSQITQYEQKTNFRLKLDVSYTLEYLDRDGAVTKTEDKIETLQGSIGGFVMINPNFYE